MSSFKTCIPNMSLISDMPNGPLDEYRKRAKFDWKQLRLYLFGEEQLAYQKEAYEYLKNNPLFANTLEEKSLENERLITFRKVKEIINSKIFYPEDLYSNKNKIIALGDVLNNYDRGLQTKKGVHKDMCLSTLKTFGTDRHTQFLESSLQNKVGFCFCMTEIGHGSNTKEVRTEARYDPTSQSFILNTPDFEAAKAWAGGLGKSSTMAIVYAQLYTADGKNHGLHSFVVPLRNPITMIPYPGITIIDMGPKIGCDGVDNGVASFHDYYIPRKNLLNVLSDVTPEGKFVPNVKDPKKMLGLTFGTLVGGRISVTRGCQATLCKAVTIAVRYAAVRKQFKIDNSKDEVSIIEYPLHQWKLFSYLANSYLVLEFSNILSKHFYTYKELQESNKGDFSKLALYIEEIHALSSASKTIASWWAQEGIQQCRELCGGHGYLKAAGLGKLRNDNDASVTFEGANNVLIQQTSKWLIKLWSNRRNNIANYPMGTVAFLKNADIILAMKWKNDALRMSLTNEDIVLKCIEALEWLVCWLCSVVSDEVKNVKNITISENNNIQIFQGIPLAYAFLEVVMLKWYYERAIKTNRDIAVPLIRLGAYFGLRRLENKIALFMQGGMISDPEFIKDTQRHLQRLQNDILDDAVSLVDAIAPPDFCLQSCLGNSDGRVYDHLKQAMLSYPNATGRDTNWTEYVLSKL